MSLEVNIRKSFSSFTLDVAFEAGDETLGFLGASGCGKSLTMRCIAGIETPDEGRIVVNDRVFFDSERKINLTPQQRKTALLFQSYMLFPNLTVAENVAAGIGREASKADRDALVAEYHKYPALPPVFDFMDDKAPGKVRKLKPVWTADGYILFWTAPKYKDEMDRAVRYVVYRFADKEKVNIDDPSHIVAITNQPWYKLPYEDGKTKYRYVVTALDRLHNESKSVKKKIKL